MCAKGVGEAEYPERSISSEVAAGIDAIREYHTVSHHKVSVLQAAELLELLPDLVLACPSLVDRILDLVGHPVTVPGGPLICLRVPTNCSTLDFNEQKSTFWMGNNEVAFPVLFPALWS
jgi:hypothetical protein